MELSQVYLVVDDLGSERGFHERALGLSPRRVGESSVEYAVGDVDLKLQTAFPDDVLSEYGMRPPSREPGDDAVVVLETGGLDDATGRLRAAFEDGVHGEVLYGPRETDWGERILLVRSPSDHVYELR